MFAALLGPKSEMRADAILFLQRPVWGAGDFAFKAQPKVWLGVLSVFLYALFAGDHGANEIFTMNEAG